jgi:heme exporter protein A
MLEGINLTCVRGGRTIFSRLDFAVDPGELLLVQGANGSGKTSLLRMICGLLAPDAGHIRWYGREIGRARQRYHAEMAYSGHSPAIKDDLTALENLLFACRLDGVHATREAAAETLGRMGLGHCLELPAKYLSQGQRRRVALARLALRDARLWILDEPLTALDQAAAGLVQSMIGAHLRQGGMAILTTHQPIAVDGIEPKLLHLSP